MPQLPAPEPGVPVIVLVEPRIAANVGAIGRLCVAAGAHLAIVRPIPFDLPERSLRRAGMDDWERLRWSVHRGWAEARAAAAERTLWFVETGAPRSLSEASFAPGDGLVFGSETDGLAPAVMAEAGDRALRIPMWDPQARSLNPATACAVALYELRRQTG
jgi:tRNA (cytidine/uridine-2'-O-)-methyltransferase